MIKCILDSEEVEKAAAKDERYKEHMWSYDCDLCGRFIWWDEPHKHRVGEKVNRRDG